MSKAKAKQKWAKNEPRLWYDPKQTMCLGCVCCPELNLCGGLRLRENIFDCTAFCQCSDGERESCELACPNNPGKFVARQREVGGWALDIEPARSVVVPKLPRVVAMIKLSDTSDHKRANTALRLVGKALGLSDDEYNRLASDAINDHE